MRMLGGALILTLVTAIMNDNVKQTLLEVLPQDKVAEIFRTAQAIASLREPTPN